jgi:hypothetical protein
MMLERAVKVVKAANKAVAVDVTRHTPRTQLILPTLTIRIREVVKVANLEVKMAANLEVEMAANQEVKVAKTVLNSRIETACQNCPKDRSRHLDKNSNIVLQMARPFRNSAFELCSSMAICKYFSSSRAHEIRPSTM